MSTCTCTDMCLRADNVGQPAMAPGGKKRVWEPAALHITRTIPGHRICAVPRSVKQPSETTMRLLHMSWRSESYVRLSCTAHVIWLDTFDQMLPRVRAMYSKETLQHTNRGAPRAVVYRCIAYVSSLTASSATTYVRRTNTTPS